MQIWEISYTSGHEYRFRPCGGGYEYCDGGCCYCNKANIIYSNRTQTLPSEIPSIHIVGSEVRNEN